MMIENYNSLKSYLYRTSVGKVRKEELLGCIKSKINQIENMINFDNYTRKITIADNLNWPYTPDYPYKLFSGGSGFGKTNALAYLINQKLLIRYVYTQKIHLKNIINFYLRNVKMYT